MLVVADPRRGGRGGLAGSPQPVVVAGAQLARRHLGRRPTHVGHDLRQAVAVLLGGPIAAGELGLGLHPLALLDLDRVFGGAHGLPRRRLLGVQLGPPLPVGTAEHREHAVVQFGGVGHPVQQRDVVADDQQRARPVGEQVDQRGPRGPVQVVGGFVEQGDLGARHPDARDGHQHRLAAGNRPDVTVQIQVGQPELGQQRAGPGLDVPVVADGLEVLRGGVAGLDGGQRRPALGDPEQLRDAGTHLEGQRLG